MFSIYIGSSILPWVQMLSYQKAVLKMNMKVPYLLSHLSEYWYWVTNAI